MGRFGDRFGKTLPKALEYGPEAFCYLLALAFQVSGYTSTLVAGLLAVLGTVWLGGHLLHKWHHGRIKSSRHGVEPSHLIMFGLIGILLSSGAAFVGFIWQQYQAPVPPQVGSSGEGPGPQTASGPLRQGLGPLTAIDMLDSFKEAMPRLGPKHWVILFTSAPENEQLMLQVWRLVVKSAKDIHILDHPNYDIEIDAPKFSISDVSGFIFHGKNELTDEFSKIIGRCFYFRRTEQRSKEITDYYKSPDIVWIQIGKGSPWKTAEACRE
jgi:hypothetical protein